MFGIFELKQGREKRKQTQKLKFSDFKLSKKSLFNEKMEIKQIVCEVCGELVDEDKYRRHLNNGHKDKREFRCDLCGKEFTSKNFVKISEIFTI